MTVPDCETALREQLAASPRTASRFLALLVGVAIATPCVVVSLLALSIPATLTYVATAVIVVVGAVVANAKAPDDLAKLPNGGRLLFVLWLVFSGVAVYRISSLAVFIDDPSRTEYAFKRTFRPLDDDEFTKPFHVKHNCSTCYIVAAYLAGEGVSNLYDRKHYRDAEVKTPVHETIGETLDIDQYQYPPPFLLGPYAVYATGLDFFQIRSLWFGLSVFLFVLTSVVLTVWVCGWGFGPLWLIWPAILVASNSIATLQMGNAHVFMVLISILALLLFEKRRFVLGGTLLAYATLSKFFPGLLIVYLLSRRKWTAVAWTVAACFALSGATLLVLGPAPYEAFINHQLPAITSGKAFWFAFEMPRAMLANSSVMGMLYKLKGMGIASQWDPRSTAGIATWIYTVIATAIAIIAGLRHASLDGTTDSQKSRTRLLMVRAWVALLVLGQLRSPFLPALYGHVAILILLALLLPVERISFPRLLLIGVGMVLFAVVLPLPLGPTGIALDFGFGLFTTLLALAIAVVVATQRDPRPLLRG